MIAGAGRTIAGAVSLGLLFAGEAQAHPHIWVTVSSDLVYAADGSVVAMRHAWAFDEMSSAFIIRDAAITRKDRLAREDFASLARAHVDSLKQLDYFTNVKANGINLKFGEPADYRFELGAGVLTLHFTLPFQSTAKTPTLEVAVYDPSYFVDISLIDEDPVVLVNAPPGCDLSIVRKSWAQVANKIVVTCP